MAKNTATVFMLLIVFSILLISCHSNTENLNSIAKDSASIATGKTVFDQKCSSCHNFRQDGIGPQLTGVTNNLSVSWIKNFIRSPKAMIDSGDSIAKKLYSGYRTTMPSFAGLTKEEVNGILAFLNAHKSGGKSLNGDHKDYKKNIVAPIMPSDLLVGLKLLTQIQASGKEPLTRIVKLDAEPKTGHLYILDLRGKLYKINNSKAEEYLDIAKIKNKFINQPGLATGFGSFALHPDFAKNGLFYTTHTEPAGTRTADFKYADTTKVAMQWVVTEWNADVNNPNTFSGKSRELFRVDMCSGIHGVQEISFNPFAKNGDEDFGQLYIGIGDGGTVENGHPEFAHNLKKIWGTIIRIDPIGNNSANRQYGISIHNPFANKNDGTLKEIYAYGFRNPNHISWTRSGSMLASNIGQANIESVNLILKGHDYGWPIREGTFVLNPSGDLNQVFPLTTKDSLVPITYPVAQYDHSEGKAIAGGFDYWGKSVPELKGKYLFGDIVTGRLFYVYMKDIKLGKQAPIHEWNIIINGKKENLHDICGSDRVDLRFGRDNNGEMFLFTKSDGKVYKLVKKY